MSTDEIISVIQKQTFSSGETVDISSTNHQFARKRPALYVGGAGNVAVVMANDEAVTFVGVQAGQLLNIAIKQVTKVGTTATSMIALN